MRPLTAALTAAVAAFMAAFAVGTQRNIRKGNTALRWLQVALPALGRRASLRWLGSSAVVVGISEPREPFAEVEAVVVLEPRDLVWLRAWGRSRGRRDFLILRARLIRSPRFELEAGDLKGWTGHDGRPHLDTGTWQEADWGYPGVRIAHTSEADPEEGRRHWERLTAASGGVWRLSIRRTPPHLDIHVLFPNISEVGPEPLVGAFRDLGRSVIGPG
ncbi:MAG: hypothetical protein ACRDJG_07425 [Actinomycetota bacterium]